MLISNKSIEVSLAKSLQSSYDRQSLCEITIMCEGKKIRCHRHVLCLHSTHFTELFNDPFNFPTAIAVVNMKYEHLKHMMDYMYHGKIKLPDNNEEMVQIIKCAGDLGLTALVKFIEEYMKTHSKRQSNSLNGDHKLAICDMNGDADSASKRKRASDATARVNLDSAKKPKINDSFTGPLNQSTPLRDGSKSILKSSSTETKPNSELSNDKKRKSDDSDEDDDESSIKRAKEKEAEEERKRKEAEKKKRQEEEERKRREEEEKQRLEAERRKRAEEEKRKAAEEKRKAEEEERIRIEEERKRKEEEKRKKEEEEAKKIEEEKNKKENNSDDTKLCNVCNKEYKYNVDHKKILEGVQFDKKCIIGNCSKPLKFRRSLIDHLLKEHKIDVCDG